jgi:hypothetical protein
MMFAPIFDQRPPQKPVRSCCGAMRQALRLRPPVLLGEVGRKRFGIAVYNTYVPGEGYRFLSRQAFRHCPWCGKVVNRWWDGDANYEWEARLWESAAKKQHVVVPRPEHACAWLRAHLANEDTFIVYGLAEGLLFPRFSVRHAGGRLTGAGLPIWHCPGCGEEIAHGHPEPTKLPQEVPIPRGTKHPRY